MHRGTRIPYGTMANGDLRNLRIKAHRKFDQVWQTGIMNRDNAYRWLADYLCVGLGDAHIGMFGEYNCKKLIEECNLMLERHQKASQGGFENENDRLPERTRYPAYEPCGLCHPYRHTYQQQYAGDI